MGGECARLSLETVDYCSDHFTLFQIPAGTSERDLQAHFKQHLGATAELEMRCVRGVPLKDPKAIPNGAIKIKNTRYATLTFSGRDPHATALKGVDDMNGKKLQVCRSACAACACLR